MNTTQNEMAKNQTSTNEKSPAHSAQHSLQAKPNHWVVGPGAVGRLLAMRLAGQLPVVLIGRREPPSRLMLITPEGEQIPRTLPGATPEFLPPRPPEMIHLTTKAHSAKAAITALTGRVPAATPLVLWQNGFGVQETLTRSWPGPVLCASTTEGAFVDDTPERHAVVHAGHGRTVIGHLDGAYPELAESLAETLSAAGLACQAATDIRVRLWHKLAVNAAINPLVARFRIRNGQLRDRPFRPMVEALVAELALIMAAEGIPAPPDGWSAQVWNVAAATANNRASMLQDVLAGRPTEIDAILGPLRAAAERHGITTPSLDDLWESPPVAS